ncbi:MAG: 2-dehydropantoate 2-reductase [Firmicutes bacterium HGW-Firmicutes-11]|nr:MAG: 2-dehydropantoate 2-reductase [Firmicutes bacterium HGW-Firmicutes-11]
MRIAIIGAGAMGCLYGGLLSASGQDVTLLDIMEDHVKEINENGLRMEGKSASGSFEEQIFDTIKATTNPLEIGVVDLVIIFVKSTFTRQATEANRVLFGPDTTVLTLQNGMGNVDAIATVADKANIIAGTTAHGATMLGPGHIRHAGSGKTILGELDGKVSKRMEEIAALFNQAGLETEVTENVTGLLWDKLLVNVGINALTAILGVTNGKLVETRESESLLEQAVEEGKKVAEARGVRLNHSDPVAHTKEVCRATAENRSSMLQDITNGRKTEIDMINGAIVREGRAVSIPTPVNELLTLLIKSKEALK